MAEIKHLIVINAPAAVVYRALTEQRGLAGWWTVQTVATPVVGSIAQFRFGDRYHDEMRIVRLDEAKRVEWVCVADDKEWVDTTFVFDLDEAEGVTTVRFCHGNWRTATDFFASCNTHWGHYMMSLKNYCETGVGEPFDEPVA